MNILNKHVSGDVRIKSQDLENAKNAKNAKIFKLQFNSFSILLRISCYVELRIAERSLLKSQEIIIIEVQRQINNKEKI